MEPAPSDHCLGREFLGVPGGHGHTSVLGTQVLLKDLQVPFVLLSPWDIPGALQHTSEPCVHTPSHAPRMSLSLPLTA